MSIGQTLYHALIAPRQHDEDARNRELVLNVLLSGTFFLSLLILVLLVIKMTVLGEAFLSARTSVAAVVCAFVGALYWLSRQGWFKTASYVLIAIYFGAATGLILYWGIGLPMPNMLYGLVIVLAGILLGARFSLYAATTIAITMVLVQAAISRGLITPDWSWATFRPGMSDVFGSISLFAILALVSWLFNRQMERSLHKAERAEAALLKQKEMLEITVEERTRELQAAQLEKIQQMYRFAELGQLSTAMMHDLANHLTSLTINIESLEGEKRSKVLADAKRSIRHIDDMVVRVRDQLNGRTNTKTFNIISETNAVIKMLRPRAQRDGVELQLDAPSDDTPLRVRGDPIRFRQMVANMVSNGIDAYDDTESDDEPRKVQITVADTKRNVVITVSDWGAGVPEGERAALFEPFYSTKQTGMGMGLFIVKQIVEEHFLGTVQLNTPERPTSFVVTLPKATA